LRPADPSQRTVYLGSGVGMGARLSGFTLEGGQGRDVILVENGAAPLIRDNVFRDHNGLVQNALSIGCYGASPTIEYNLFYHNRSIGCVGVFTGNARIFNNTFDDNSRGFWSQSVLTIAKNNIVTNSVAFGIGDYRFAVSDYNCVFNNNPDYGYGAIPGAQDITADPLYCNRANKDFQLDFVSPCNGTGEGGLDRGAYDAGCVTDR